MRVRWVLQKRVTDPDPDPNLTTRRLRHHMTGDDGRRRIHEETRNQANTTGVEIGAVLDLGAEVEAGIEIGARTAEAAGERKGGKIDMTSVSIDDGEEAEAEVEAAAIAALGQTVQATGSLEAWKRPRL
mmetsp:Transcript_34250/g.75361  ORF Transcript_34250/g.75361 Transcript_34250/m.75361 type:complete len:129 (-) Transcript_34250:1099-1485(-)